ncbi:carboxylating nicotinate-nucleotide diphosphorylase [bacterium]|nr:MAG: carboxylating nicotinate-nucleotide diphosphorylase [bacterium]
MNRENPVVFPDGAPLRDLVARALAEDVGTGDATTAVTVDPASVVQGEIRARTAGVVAGLPLLPLVFGALDGGVVVTGISTDGDPVAPGEVVARLAGPAQAILTGERTALNFLQYLSGIATGTAAHVRAVAGTGCRVLDTRKTLPGWRALAKYAVRCGGGYNHRMGLYDRIMLKDNHWLAGGGDVASLVARARRLYPDLMVEVEVDELAQLSMVLPLGVEWILLDNFTVEAVAQAVALRDTAGVATRLEVSGNVNLQTIGDYAVAGADAVSVGCLTHSVQALDLGLDLQRPAGEGSGP